MKTLWNLRLCAAVFVALTLYLAGPFVLQAFGFYYSGCVGPAFCESYASSGYVCIAVLPYDGSQAQTGGIAATGDACAYTTNWDGWGWACGGAVPTDPPEGGCN